MYPPTRRAIQLNSWDRVFLCIDKSFSSFLATSVATIAPANNVVSTYHTNVPRDI